MSNYKKDIFFPDYLDVSSDEEHKNDKKVKYNEIMEEKNKKERNSYDSYESGKNYYKYKYNDKYYNKRYKEESRSYSHSSRSRKSKNRYKHRSRSNNKYKKKYKYKSSSSSRNKSRRNSREHRNKHLNYNYYDRKISSRSRSRNKSKVKSQKIENKKDYINKDNYENIRKDKNNNYNNEEKKLEIKDSNKKVDKWSEGIKKEELKPIKIEKYDKNKPKKYTKNSEKEISQLKKDLKNEKSEEIIEKEKPNFEPSGILEKDLQNEYSKSIDSKIPINYKPPNDSIIPNDIWFLFKFLDEKKEANETYKLVGKEFFLIGKDVRICDIQIKQKNISRQHAVIQFRRILKNNKDLYEVPYLIDLNSTNGTFLNGEKIDNSKYYELRDKDNLNFGDKKIDFVLMKMK